MHLRASGVPVPGELVSGMRVYLFPTAECPHVSREMDRGDDCSNICDVVVCIQSERGRRQSVKGQRNGKTRYFQIDHFVGFTPELIRTLKGLNPVLNTSSINQSTPSPRQHPSERNAVLHRPVILHCTCVIVPYLTLGTNNMSPSAPARHRQSCTAGTQPCTNQRTGG
jgi:hypothetical protein